MMLPFRPVVPLNRTPRCHLTGTAEKTRPSRIEGNILGYPKWMLMSDLGVMSAVPETEFREVEVDAVSPELALVDPDLVAPAASQLVRRERRPGWLANRGVADQIRDQTLPRAGLMSQRDDRRLEARQRLLEAGVASDVLGSIVPRGRQLRRRAMLIPALSAACSVALLVFQLYVGQGAL